MKSLFILGRQPALSLAELESRFGAAGLTRLGHGAAAHTIDPASVPFMTLGGSLKLAKILTQLDSVAWNDIEAHLVENIPKHLHTLPDGKLTLGLSAYGIAVTASRLNATGLKLKKIIKAHGRPVRVVPNKQPALSSAQVLHNNLTGQNGWELILLKNGPKTILALTLQEQDIDAYSRRDRRRPYRDARVGMLPPKLAQIIVNLAVGDLPIRVMQSPDNRLVSDSTVLDPFCGTGVVLQEALLAGHMVYGSDLEPQMVEYTVKNLEWLAGSFNLPLAGLRIERGDAAKHRWQHSFQAVAAETYLGRPLHAPATPADLRTIVPAVDRLHRDFLHNMARQSKPGLRLCLGVPAWRTGSGFHHLPVLDHLDELGYNRMSFVHARPEELIYHRTDQFVARELVVLTRN